MNFIDWSQLEEEGKFWKPENNSQYLVIFQDWIIEYKSFDSGLTTKKVLTLKVIGYQKDNALTLPNDMIYCNPPKEFSIKNKSFIKGIKPIINNAINAGQKEIYVLLKKTGSGQETEYNINDASFLKSLKRGAE